MIEKLRSVHKADIEPFLRSPNGCSLRDVKKTEDVLGYRLAACHREFLLWMGRDKRGIFQGSCVFVDDLVPNREVLDGLLQTNNLSLPQDGDVCVFFTHQGYQAAWYDLP